MPKPEPHPALGVRFYAFASLWVMLVLTWLWWIWGPSIEVSFKTSYYHDRIRFGGYGLVGVYSFLPASPLWYGVIRALATFAAMLTLVMLFCPGRGCLSRLHQRGRLPGGAIISMAIAWAILLMSIHACFGGILGYWHSVVYDVTWSNERFYRIAPQVLIFVAGALVVVNALRSPHWAIDRIIRMSLWCLMIGTAVLLVSTALLAIRIAKEKYSYANVFPYDAMGVRLNLHDDYVDGVYSAWFLSFSTVVWTLGALVVARMLRPRVLADADTSICRSCKYDLRGSIAAGRRECPECGQSIDSAPDNLARQDANG